VACAAIATIGSLSSTDRREPFWLAVQPSRAAILVATAW
jgi:hypothetical protein